MQSLTVNAENLLTQGTYGICRSFIKKLSRLVWIVRFRRNNRNVGVRCFYDHHYPSTEAALEAAKHYRNELLLIYPPESSKTVRQRLMKNNTSGIAGIGLVHAASGDYWIAATQLHGGKTLTSRFAVRVHGGEKAKQLAIAARQRHLQEVDYPRVCDPQARRFFAETALNTPLPKSTYTDASKNQKLCTNKQD